MLNGIQLPMPSAPRAIEGLSQPQSGGAGNASFKDFMLQAIDQVNAMQVDADHSVEQLLTGGDVNPAEVLTAVQKADLSFRMMLQVRNKLMQAFQEIKELRI
jgi:flagellar hook-basal body complex protein FliE